MSQPWRHDRGGRPSRVAAQVETGISSLSSGHAGIVLGLAGDSLVFVGLRASPTPRITIEARPLLECSLPWNMQSMWRGIGGIGGTDQCEWPLPPKSKVVTLLSQGHQWTLVCSCGNLRSGVSCTMAVDCDATQSVALICGLRDRYWRPFSFGRPRHMHARTQARTHARTYAPGAHVCSRTCAHACTHACMHTCMHVMVQRN